MSECREPAGFDRIYATDLVFVPDCWKLCGNAHCCNFSRYKSQFKMIGRTHFQELPLLPGEYEFLRSKGWLEQFGDYDHKVVEFPLDRFVIKAESIVSRRPGCACDHATRPTICRLYPLLPRFDLEGRLTGTEKIGIFEELEEIGNLDPACQVTSLPFREFDKFAGIIAELGKNPCYLYYLEAYRMTKHHVAARVSERVEEGRSVFSIFEAGFLRKNLIAVETLRDDLNRLADRFEDRYGPAFHRAT